MKRGKKGRGKTVYAATALMVFGLVQTASAGLTFTSGTVTLTHDCDISAANPIYSIGPTAITQTSQEYPASPWQLENIVTTGRSSTYAAGSVGEMANSQGGGIVLASRTILTQDDQDGVYAGAS